ncbi:8-hydroxygeraniol oxidoreductase-like [Nicotiana tomentosiformis]|uniref:8-hydroxygeraniol oxidoreductase-like n=1 Tax=Nicotiana tomentosiformis TaxID=4098 RepID=UPI00051C3855|nr:8-hydroxygeraniol oxidoreductase-like [Nicotiana tomentosiformis]
MNSDSYRVISCKAAVVWKSGEELKLEEIEVDPPNSTEVRIKMMYASLCGTDVLCCNGFPKPLFPRIPGHEGVGVIESVGEKVKILKEGDIVIPHFLGECGDCPNCKSKKSNLCHKYPLNFSGLLLDGTSRMSIKGQRIYHHVSCSTLSEYLVLDQNYVIKIDPRLPIEHAAFLCCAFTTGFGSTFKDVNIEKGSTVAVLGLGGVGLGVVEGARQKEAAKIIGIDIHEIKSEKAKIFGVTDFINIKVSEKSVSELVKEATGGLGVDYFFECTNVPDLMINEAIQSTRMGYGTVILLGAGLELDWQMSYVPLMLGRTLKGSIYGGIRTRTDLPYIFDKCINKEIKLDELLTHEVSLNDVNKAFEYLKEPNCVKVLIKF